MGYVQPSRGVRRGGRRAARGDPRRRRGATTTFGYGPRFLHSTGSSTRAARRSGAFCSCCTTARRTWRSPARPYTFTTLKNAQAIGDFETLRELGLPAERVRLNGEDAVGALRALTETIKEAHVTQIGFVGLGKMGGNMVHRIRRDSEHEVVAFDFDAQGGQAGGQERRRRAPAR